MELWEMRYVTDTYDTDHGQKLGHRSCLHSIRLTYRHHLTPFLSCSSFIGFFFIFYIVFLFLSCNFENDATIETFDKQHHRYCSSEHLEYLYTDWEEIMTSARYGQMFRHQSFILYWIRRISHWNATSAKENDHSNVNLKASNQ